MSRRNIFQSEKTVAAALAGILLAGALALCIQTRLARAAPGDIDLWSRVEQQILRSNRFVYRGPGPLVPAYRGYVTSNEAGHLALQLPQDELGFYVGFGSVINLNILAQRSAVHAPGGVLFADQSIEVVAMMQSFWRPLILAAEQPAELLAYVAGYRFHPKMTVADYFEMIRKDAPTDTAMLGDVGPKLDGLVRAGKLTLTDKDFAMRVLDEQVNPPISKAVYLASWKNKGESPPKGFFRRARRALFIGHHLMEIYTRQGIEETFGQAAQKLRQIDENLARMTFLETTRLARLRSIFLRGLDLYAVANASDQALWTAIHNTAASRGVRVTDIYLSNIPFFAQVVGDDPGFFVRIAETLHQSGRPHAHVYEASVNVAEPLKTFSLEPCGMLQRAIDASSTQKLLP